jgi:RND family efflux transporter MFP subunit
MNRAFPLSLAALCLLAGAGCVNRGAQAQAARTNALISDPAIPVTVMTVNPTVVDEVLEVSGSMAANEDTAIASLAGGKLVQVTISEGDSVAAGQVVALLDTEDSRKRVAQARASLDAARSQVTLARNEAAAAPLRSSSAVRAAEARVRQSREVVAKLKSGARTQERNQAAIQVERADSDLKTAKAAVDRARRLYNEGAIAKADLEQIENRYDNAMAAYKAALEGQSLANNAVREEDIRIAQNDLAAAEEVLRIERTQKSLDANFRERVSSALAGVRSAEQQLALAEKAVRDGVVRSPISGRISSRPLQSGTIIAPGTPVARVVATSDLAFEPELTEAQVARIQPGMEVNVTVAALDGAQLTGRVETINPVASSVGRLFKVRVLIQETEGRLKPGMFGKGFLVVGRRENVYRVPDRAVLRDGMRAWVLVNDGGKSVRRTLSVVRSSGNEVIATGLKPADQVIVRGQQGLLEGAVLKTEASQPGDAP